MPRTGSVSSLWDKLLASPAPAAGPQPFVPKPKRYHDPGPLRRLLAILEWGYNSPAARGLDAVMNSIDRAEMGFIAGLGGSGDAGGGARYPGLARRRAAQGGGGDPFARAAHAFLTPAESTDTTHQAEAVLHMPNFVAPPPGWKSPNRKSYDPGAVRRAAQLTEDMGLETVSDLTMYFPVLNTFSMLGKAARVGRAGARLAGKPLGSAANAAGKAADAVQAAARPMIQTVTGRTPNAFRYQTTVGKPEVSTLRGGTFIKTDKPEVGGEYSGLPGRSRIDLNFKPRKPLKAEGTGLVEVLGKARAKRFAAGIVRDPAKFTARVGKATGLLPTGLESAEDAFIGAKARKLGYDAIVFPQRGDAFVLDPKALRYAGPPEKVSGQIRTAVNRAQAAAERTGDRIQTSIVEGHDLRKAGSRPLEDTVKGHEGAGREVLQHETERYGELIGRYHDMLNQLGNERLNLEHQIADTTMTAQERAGWPPAYVRDRDALRLQLSQKLGAMGDRLPPGLRREFDRAAYLEGTSEVRRKVMAAGFVPTKEEAASPVLNILHTYESAYEPTQKLFPKLTKAEASAMEGPVRYYTQGNKKAPFDLPKLGGTPDEPLADRMLDRLVRGAKLREYHTTRRKILADLGLEPSRIENIGRAEARGEAAMGTGDLKRAARYAALAAKQRTASDAAAAKRAGMLKPGTPFAPQELEYLDPISANERALRDAKLAGRDTAGIDAHTSHKSLADLLGQHKGDKRSVRLAENAVKIAARGAAGTQRGVTQIAEKYKSNLARAVGGIKRAADQQSGRVAKLGAALENHDLVRAGLRSHIPGLQESARDLQAAYVAAKQLAGVAYKSGFGKDVDQTAHRIASERLDHPAGTNLTVIGEGEATKVLGGRTMGATPYSKADIAEMRAAIRKSKKAGNKDATGADAVRVLDEAHNAVGSAREQVDKIARDYDVRTAHVTPEGVADSIKEMRDLFRKTHAGVQTDLSRKPAVAGAIRRAIAAVSQGDSSLQGAIGKAATPQDVSLARALAPSRKALEQTHDAAGKVVGKAQSAQVKLDQLKRKNAAVAAMDVDAEAAMKARNSVEIPEALQRRLFDDVPHYNKSLAAAFSDLQRDALFVLPYAHRKNITVLAGLGPNGISVIRRGIQIAREMRADKTHAKYAAQIKELEDMGAAMNFAKEGERGYEKIPVIGKPVGQLVDKLSTDALDRYDTAMRLALMEHLATKNVRGFQAGGQIRDVLGDYHNQAPLITELGRRAGANFPAWGLGIVPRAVTKAIREQPRSVQTYARSQRLFSDDVTQPWFGADFDMGGPVEDAVRLGIGPWRYLTGRSRVGPIADLFGLGGAAWRGEVLPFLGQELLSPVPFGSVLGATANFPYPSNASIPTRAAASLFGSYFPTKPPLNTREAQLETLGMPRAKPLHLRGMGPFKIRQHPVSPEVRRELQWENYFGAPTFPRPGPSVSPSPSP